MKKLIALILLILSILTFFIVYSDYKEAEEFKMKNAERHLKNSQLVVIPSKLTSSPKDVQKITMLDSSNGSGASLYFSRIDQNGDGEKIIKYVHIQDQEYMNNFKIIKGRPLNKGDMETENYISTKESNDKNQVGVIGTIGEFNMEIRPFTQMFRDKAMVSGECIISLSEGASIESFRDILENKIDGTVESREPKDIGYVTSSRDKYMQIGALFTIFILLMLYDILVSYKKILIEKMLGYSLFHIWKKRIKHILFIQIGTIVLSTIIMSLLMINSFKGVALDFYKILGEKYIILMLITLVVATIPFIYVHNINVIGIIKNKKNVKEIIITNKIVKILLCIGLVYIINLQAVNYKEISKTFDKSYSRWEQLETYRVLSLTNIDEAMFFSKGFEERSRNAYKQFNSQGAVFADFKSFEEKTKSYNTGVPEYRIQAMINPNFLLENEIYDENGKRIFVSEEEQNFIMIIPEKYKEYKEEIINGTGQPPSEVRIIWMKSNQRVFSYNPVVNIDEDNYVKDPGLIVIPGNGPFIGFTSNSMFNVEGNPMKVKVSEKGEEGILNILDQLGISSHGVSMNYGNEQVASKGKDYRDMFKWIIIGVISSLSIIGVLIVQSINNFVEQYKVRFALRQLHGFKLIDKYKEYLMLVLISWGTVLLGCILLDISTLKLVLGVTLVGGIIEILISLIVLTLNEKRKVTKFIKGGI